MSFASLPALEIGIARAARPDRNRSPPAAPPPGGSTSVSVCLHPFLPVSKALSPGIRFRTGKSFTRGNLFAAARAACSAGIPLSFQKKGGEKTPEGNRDDSPPPLHHAETADQRPQKCVLRLRLPSGESSLKHHQAHQMAPHRQPPLPWPTALLQLQRLGAQPVGAVLGGCRGIPPPARSSTAFLRKRKRCPRRAGGSLK